jgi:hypothetical protein
VWQCLLVPGLVKSALPRIRLNSFYLDNAKAFSLFAWVDVFILLCLLGTGAGWLRCPPQRAHALELTVIQQSLALVTAPAVAQCPALLCISQCALVAAKSAHMDLRCSNTLDLPIPGFLMTTYLFAITLYGTTNSFLGLYLHPAFATSAWVAVPPRVAAGDARSAINGSLVPCYTWRTPGGVCVGLPHCEASPVWCAIPI